MMKTMLLELDHQDGSLLVESAIYKCYDLYLIDYTEYIYG
ncbi:hypothetical protein XBJ2_2370008 [Xenorhabdus bovienii str. Jollieti]|uniref:Uncharacterized protein n=1 Tax=Xenorhabdus bovienii (strain SS-2004) TaxID=406818 RepID=D3V770_XENBS|nr:hypothetical protein XBJ1_4396 [Xenorhabdus bovienii SS-2004]CDH29243.1 hypothetical protein XBJ2_2370008 [Xenorhabdus bovienii str. Jollieti]